MAWGAGASTVTSVHRRRINSPLENMVRQCSPAPCTVPNRRARPAVEANLSARCSWCGIEQVPPRVSLFASVQELSQWIAGDMGTRTAMLQSPTER
jgi:hypothetical protein